VNAGGPFGVLGEAVGCLEDFLAAELLIMRNLIAVRFFFVAEDGTAGLGDATS